MKLKRWSVIGTTSYASFPTNQNVLRRLTFDVRSSPMNQNVKANIPTFQTSTANFQKPLSFTQTFNLFLIFFLSQFLNTPTSNPPLSPTHTPTPTPSPSPPHPHPQNQSPNHHSTSKPALPIAPPLPPLTQPHFINNF